jgi:hypothetical protein
VHVAVVERIGVDVTFADLAGPVVVVDFAAAVGGLAAELAAVADAPVVPVHEPAVAAAVVVVPVAEPAVVVADVAADVVDAVVVEVAGVGSWEALIYAVLADTLVGLAHAAVDAVEDASQEDTGAVEMMEVVAVRDEVGAFAFQPQPGCRWEDWGCMHR